MASYTFTTVTAAHTIAASFSLNTYTIAASSSAGGSISPTGNVSVNCGGSQQFTLHPDACYSIADIVVDGNSVGASLNYMFTNVTANHTIVASFSLDSYTIVASAGAGGSITPSGNVSVNCGANQSFAIAADPCYSIADVVVDGNSVGAVASYTFTAVGTPHFITASFSLNTYTIAASAGAGGSISPSGNVSVNCGANQSFTIAADPCYSIADVLVDGSSVGAVASYTFTNVTAAHTIAASFSLNTYTIAASAGSGGSISPSGNVSVNCGANQAFAIAADPCYSIADVLVDGGSIGAVSSYTFSNVTAAHTIAASFSLNTYTIAASAGAGGSISPSGNVSVNCGANQAFTIAADPCYSIADVLVDGGSVGAVASYTFSNVTAPHTIAASFSLNTYTIAASAGAGGSISPSGNVSVNCGSNQSFTIAADPCYSIADVLVDGGSVGAVASYTFNNVTAAHTIAASFSLNTYTITASAGAGGSISPTGSVSVNCGANQSFTIAANSCFAIANVVVDGGSVGTVSSYTFSNVTANHTISASFTALGYTISASAGTGGSITPVGNQMVLCGQNKSFTIAPASCYSISDVLVDGSSVGAVSSYTFTNVSANHTIAAAFSLNTYTITASAGSGGSISPTGSVPVNCGASSVFAVSGDACHSIADVLVDGGSVGAVSSYTFSNVTANHTIAASFSLIAYTITASAGSGGSISPSGAVSVNCGSNQSFTIAANACNSIADVLVDGGSVGAVSSYTFSNVTGAHTIAASFTLATYTITASAGSGGTISPSGAVSVNCGANQSFAIAGDACHHVADVLVDGSSVGAVASYTFNTVSANHTIAASFAPNAATITAVTGLAAAQQKLANDADGTTKIKLTFTAPGGAASVEVWRKGFGSYPTYDNGGGATPSLPGSYPPAGWSLTAVSASGQSDEPSSRDFWYYVAYAKDACGNPSPVSAMTSGTLDYHLGDVSNGFVAGTGDNTVSTADVSLLGAHYGLSGGALAGFEYLDVGPTTDHSTNARPTTDSKTDFEDLVMFALNYAPHVSLATKGGASTQSASVLSVEAPGSVSIGDEFDAQVVLTSGGNLLALSTTLGWNSGVVEPLSVTAGDLVTSQGGVMFSPGPGRADAAVLGEGSSFTGQGTLVTVRFRAIASGAPHIGIAGVEGRNSLNQSVTVNISNPLSVEAVVTATDLMPVIPNPARGRAALQYSIATRGPVDLSVFSVDGRRVKTLTHGVQEVGRYRFTWDGSDANGARIQAGVYFVRLEAPGIQKTRVINLVR